jgi:hypothetical protein
MLLFLRYLNPAFKKRTPSLKITVSLLISYQGNIELYQIKNIVYLISVI